MRMFPFLVSGFTRVSQGQCSSGGHAKPWWSTQFLYTTSFDAYGTVRCAPHHAQSTPSSQRTAGDTMPDTKGSEGNSLSTSPPSREAQGQQAKYQHRPHHRVCCRHCVCAGLPGDGQRSIKEIRGILNHHLFSVVSFCRLRIHRTRTEAQPHVEEGEGTYFQSPGVHSTC